LFSWKTDFLRGDPPNNGYGIGVDSFKEGRSGRFVQAYWRGYVMRTKRKQTEDCLTLQRIMLVECVYLCKSSNKLLC